MFTFTRVFCFAQVPILLLLLRYSNVNISATSGDCVHTQTERPTWMVVFPPSSKAMARRMLSWKTRSLVVFMMRSMTRSDAPSLSRWHCTSARLICPRLRPPTPPRAAGDKGQYYCNTGIHSKHWPWLQYLTTEAQSAHPRVNQLWH